MLVRVQNPHDIAHAIVQQTEEVRSEHAVTSTWALPALPLVNPAQNSPVEIVPLDPLRKRAVITLNGSGQIIIAHSEAQALHLQQNIQQAADEGALFTVPANFEYTSKAPLWAVGVPAFNPPNTVGAKGSVTAPGAGAVIASIGTASLTVGLTYQVNVVVYLDGTIVVATDEDNMALRFGGTTIAPLIYPGVNSVPVSTGPYYINVATSNTINVIAVGAGSVAAVYHAQIYATPYPFSPTSGIVQAGAVVERLDS